MGVCRIRVGDRRQEGCGAHRKALANVPFYSVAMPQRVIVSQSGACLCAPSATGLIPIAVTTMTRHKLDSCLSAYRSGFVCSALKWCGNRYHGSIRIGEMDLSLRLLSRRRAAARLLRETVHRKVRATPYGCSQSAGKAHESGCAACCTI